MRKHRGLHVFLILLLLSGVLLALFLHHGTEPEPASQAGVPEQLPPTMEEPEVPPEQPVEPAQEEQSPDGQMTPPEPEEETAPEETPVPVPEPETQLEPEPPAQDPLQTLLASMSLEEQVGQLFLARYPDSGALDAAKTYHLGGYLLFARDLSGLDKAQVQAMTTALQEASEIPMLLAVDEEGGTVCRVSSNPNLRATRFASPQKLLAAGGLDALRADQQEKTALLASLGLNLNLAPVCDLSQDPQDFIFDRSMGLDAQGTAEAVSVLVEAAEGSGVGAVLKHFPGYGNNADTHTGVAYDPRSYETFQTADFLPFQAGMAAGSVGVLVSHNVVQCMDPDHPASLSAEVHRILRQELGFQGVVMTDDLAMAAIGSWYSPEEAAVQAVLVGNDLLISSSLDTQYQAVLDAARSGRIPQERLEEACLRVLRWKQQLGLLE